MKENHFTFTDYAGIKVFVYNWIPEDNIKPKGVVMLIHGSMEHALRYKYVASQLTESGFIVFAEDHRGHGKTMLSIEKAGYLGPDGNFGVLKDLMELTDLIIKKYPELPLFIYGHSWGSFLAQGYIEEYGNKIKGAMLTGVVDKLSQQWLLIKILKYKIKKEGIDAKATLWDKETEKRMLKHFKNPRTKFDWLTRDEKIVDEYINDPLCGFTPPYQALKDIMEYAMEIWKPENEEKIPKDLPIYYFVGSDDSGGKAEKKVQKLMRRYEKMGVANQELKVYEGARHEVLNELNRDEIIEDMIQWIDKHL